MQVETKLSYSTYQLQEMFEALITRVLIAAKISTPQFKAMLASQTVHHLFSRKAQEQILRCDCNNKQLLSLEASKLWYSPTFRDALPRLLDKKFNDSSVSILSGIEKSIHNYFKQMNRMVFDRDTKAFYIVCDVFYDDFSPAQFEELYETAQEAMEGSMNIKKIGHCDVITSFRFQPAPYYEESKQEDLDTTDPGELCTPQHGYREKRKPSKTTSKWPDDVPGPEDMKHFTGQASFPHTLMLILYDPDPDSDSKK